jgi:hypothetical protein
VNVGIIARRTGNPHDTGQWEWRCRDSMSTGHDQETDERTS